MRCVQSGHLPAVQHPVERTLVRPLGSSVSLGGGRVLCHANSDPRYPGLVWEYPRPGKRLREDPDWGDTLVVYRTRVPPESSGHGRPERRTILQYPLRPEEPSDGWTPWSSPNRDRSGRRWDGPVETRVKWTGGLPDRDDPVTPCPGQHRHRGPRPARQEDLPQKARESHGRQCLEELQCVQEEPCRVEWSAEVDRVVSCRVVPLSRCVRRTRDHGVPGKGGRSVPETPSDHPPT